MKTLKEIVNEEFNYNLSAAPGHKISIKTLKEKIIISYIENLEFVLTKTIAADNNIKKALLENLEKEINRELEYNNIYKFLNANDFLKD